MMGGPPRPILGMRMPRAILGRNEYAVSVSKEAVTEKCQMAKDIQEKNINDEKSKPEK